MNIHTDSVRFTKRYSYQTRVRKILVWEYHQQNLMIKFIDVDNLNQCHVFGFTFSLCRIFHVLNILDLYLFRVFSTCCPKAFLFRTLHKITCSSIPLSTFLTMTCSLYFQMKLSKSQRLEH